MNPTPPAVLSIRETGSEVENRRSLASRAVQLRVKPSVSGVLLVAIARVGLSSGSRRAVLFRGEHW